MSSQIVFLTGATGLVGGRVLDELLRDECVARAYVLVRDARSAARLARMDRRVEPILGDLLQPALAISNADADRITPAVTTVVHVAATTSFSQAIAEARATNLEGTRALLDIAEQWRNVDRWVHVSSAFVAGRRVGTIRESDVAAGDGWMNGYEQSKAEAEFVVRERRPAAVIVRPSTVVCDDVHGGITQVNSVHRALRLYFRGLAAMIPGADTTRLDTVPADYVARGVARIALEADRHAGATFHLCAGRGAMALDHLLDVTHDVFALSPLWRRRGIARPLRVDLPTYRLFEAAVESAGSARVVQAVRSLGYFIPQLAFPKIFETAGAESVIGECAPPVESYWSQMVASLAGGITAEEVVAA